MYKSQRAGILRVAVCAILCTACSTTGPDLNAASVGQGLPPIPAGLGRVSPQRRSANTVGTAGTDFTAAGGAGNSALGGGVLRLKPGGEDELAYALYTLDGMTVERPAAIAFSVLPELLHPGGEDELTSAYWVGLSDYSSMCWEWQGPYTEAETLTLNGPELRERYVSAEGRFSYLIVVKALPGSAEQPALVVQSISTGTADASPNAPGYYSNRPHFARINSSGLGSNKQSHQASALDSSQYVNLTWEHVRDQGAEDNEALAVRVYRQSEGGVDRQPIGTVFSEDEIYTDPLDNSESADAPLPGQTYLYCIRAYNVGGWTEFSPPRIVTIPPDPPAELSASDGRFQSSIELRWQRAAGASGYLVYRDSQAVPVAELGDVDEWVDTSPEANDGAAHIYWVVSTIGELASRFGAPDKGFSGLPLPSEWYMFGADERHSGNLTQTIGPNVSDLLWSFDSGFVLGAPAIAANGMVYFGSGDNNLYCLTPEGQESWHFATSDILLTSPAIGPDGTIYVGGNDGVLYAVSPQGLLVWTFEDSAGYPLSSPCVTGEGVVYVGSANGRLYKVQSDGSLEWFFDTVADLDAQGNVIASSPAVGDNGDIFFGCRNNCLYAVYADSGLKHWRYLTDGDVDSSPCIDTAGVIYFGSRDTYMHAVLPNGSNKWVFKTGDGIISTPALNPLAGAVVVGSLDNRLYCVDSDTGEEIWYRQAGDDFIGSPAVDAGGNVFVGNKDGRLYAYNSGGQLVWSRKSESVWGVSMAPDGSLIFGTSVHVLRTGPGLGSGS